MTFIIITAIITLVCLFALIRSVSDKNVVGMGFSFIALLVFGFFSVMSTYEWIRDLFQA